MRVCGACERDCVGRRSSNAGHGGVAMAALLPLLASPCVTSVPRAYCYPPHSACVCAVRRRVHLLRGGKVLECDRRELISDMHRLPRR